MVLREAFSELTLLAYASICAVMQTKLGDSLSDVYFTLPATSGVCAVMDVKVLVHTEKVVGIHVKMVANK